MPHIKSTTVYYIDELSDAAKDRAREWYRRPGLGYEWWDNTYHYCKGFLGHIGWDFGSSEARIFFSGFSSQGDGACFHDVEWRAKDVRGEQARSEYGLHQNHGTPEMRGLVDEAVRLATMYPALTGYVEHCGRYSHEYCTDIGVELDESTFETDPDTGGVIVPALYGNDDSGYVGQFIEFARDCMKWVYRRLEEEYWNLTSDDQVDEQLRLNEYEFTEEGKPA